MNHQEITLEHGHFYHIYNRGINGTNLFFEERNYDYFLLKYGFYLNDVVDTYAYCLLGNHFHLLIRVKDQFVLKQPLSNLTGLQDLSGLNNQDLSGLERKGLHTPDKIVSKQFADLFNCYTKSINKSQFRTGGLFETPFKRIIVNDDKYFTQLILYIHANPEKHGFIDDFRDYKHSSYHSHLSGMPTKLSRQQVLEWFGDESKYREFHKTSDIVTKDFNHLIIEV